MPNGSTSHQKVINICRFLLTLDSNGDPSDGIEIPAGAGTKSIGLSIEFDVSGEAFENQTVKDFIDEVCNASELISCDDAKNHIENTLDKIENSVKVCDLPENQEPPFMDISGTWDLEIIPFGESKLDGVVSYYQTSNDDYPNNLSGIFYDSLGEGGIFTGAISGYEIYWDWGNGDKVKILVENVYQGNTCMICEYRDCSDGTIGIVNATKKTESLYPKLSKDNTETAKIVVAKFLNDYSVLHCLAILAPEIWKNEEAPDPFTTVQFEVLGKTDEDPEDFFSAGDTITLIFNDFIKGVSSDEWGVNGSMTLECLFFNDTNYTIRIYGEKFQDGDENELNTYYDFDTESQIIFSGNDEFDVYHTINKLTYQTIYSKDGIVSFLPFKISFQTEEPICFLEKLVNDRFHTDCIKSGKIMFTGANNSSIIVTFDNVDDLDDPISIPIYEDDDGIPEVTIDTTVRELSNYNY